MEPNNSKNTFNEKEQRISIVTETEEIRIEATESMQTTSESHDNREKNGAPLNKASLRASIEMEKEELPRCPDIPDVEDFDEDEIFCRMATDENIFNSRGLSHAPKMEESSRERYIQMGRCAQMHSHEWTNLFPGMSIESDFPIVQVRFKNTHKDFFRIPENEKPQNFQTGDIVTVESANGHDTGVICLRGELVPRYPENLSQSPAERYRQMD